MKTALLILVAAPLRSAAFRCVSLHSAAFGPPVLRRYANVQMNAASDVVDSFLSATESGDAEAAKAVCADDLLYKTHSATTESLAAAEKRLKTKVPKPKTVKQELHEESPGIFVREIVVKPVPFVTVGVRQEFEVRCSEPPDEECELSRAEYTKTSGGKD
eukprot:962443-Prymnesium_polylepis.2